MGYDIEVMADCASNYGVFKVPSSRGDKAYIVSFNGSEGPAFCTCKAFKYSPETLKHCKHIQWVWDHGCFYNPQWNGGTENPQAKPVEYTYDAVIPGEKCPSCRGPVVAVRRAV